MSGLVGTFLCLGNPLLDIAAVVDDAFLAKHDVSSTYECYASGTCAGSLFPRCQRQQYQLGHDGW